MTKKHFIALADAIVAHNKLQNHAGRAYDAGSYFYELHLDTLADFCVSQNANFDELHWRAYIRGECGPNSGKVHTYVKKTATPK